MMPKTQTLHMRIDEKLKEDVDSLFNELGISTTDAVTMFFKQALWHRGLPFEVKIPYTKPDDVDLALIADAKIDNDEKITFEDAIKEAGFTIDEFQNHN